jgi:hypothetical protein
MPSFVEGTACALSCIHFISTLAVITSYEHQILLQSTANVVKPKINVFVHTELLTAVKSETRQTLVSSLQRRNRCNRA